MIIGCEEPSNLLFIDPYLLSKGVSHEVAWYFEKYSTDEITDESPKGRVDGHLLRGRIELVITFVPFEMRVSHDATCDEV